MSDNGFALPSLFCCVAAFARVRQTVNAGTYQIDVTYVGIPIYSKTGSVCSYIACPLAPGKIDIAKTVR